MHFRAPTLALISSLLLAACGGGGGGGGGGTATVPAVNAPQAVVITEANAKPVAANALEAAQNSSATQTGGLVTGVQVEAAGSPGANQFLVMAAAARVAANALAGSPALATAVAFDQTAPCPISGSLKVSGNVASTSGLFTGDSVRITATNCVMNVEGVTSTMNGSMSFTVVSGSIVSVPFHAVISITATDLSVGAGGLTVVSTGDARMDWTSSFASDTMVVSGTSMRTRTTTGGTTRTITLKNYNQTLSVSGVIATSSLSASVETDSTQLGASGGSYTITTLTPVSWNSSTNLVTAGVVKVVGAAGSALLITIGGNSTVSLQVDANGDGSYEKTLTSTLTELDTLF